jgi:hypothetical protein
MLMISDAVPFGSAQAPMGARKKTVNPPNDMAKTPSPRLSKDLDPQALVITRARCITGGTGCLWVHGDVCHE